MELIALIVLPALLLTLGVAVVLWAVSRARAAAMDDLRRFAAELEGGATSGQPDWWHELSRCEATGRLEGHDVRVRFAGKGKYRCTNHEVQVPHPAASFDVARVDALDRLLGLGGDALTAGRDLGLRGGDPGARQLLQGREVVAGLRELLGRSGARRVTLEGTTLRVQTVGEASAWEMQKTARALVALARLVGRTPLAPRVAARFAWTDGGAAARCPFCRADLEPDAPDVAACERCGTVHHRECLDEAGGCTVFGCRAAGALAERARP